MNTFTTKKKIAISDVDGTIVRGSLVLNHACDIHDKGIANFGDLADKWRNDPKNEINITALAESYRESISGKDVHDLDVDGFINSITSNPTNFYSTLGRLVKYRAKGNPVVLISGSPSFLVGELAQKFDFDFAASDYTQNDDGTFTGDCIGMFSSNAKRDYLDKFGISQYDDVIAFGDTCSDEPLFDSAHYSVLVEPNVETKVKLEHKVHEIIFA